jgi:8-oxo-dGTP diphosphatase
MWALPGGFLKEDDSTAKECAYRELKEECCIDLQDIELRELRTYSDRYRDPRERVVTVAFVALVPKSKYMEIKVPMTHQKQGGSASIIYQLWLSIMNR